MSIVQESVVNQIEISEVNDLTVRIELRVVNGSKVISSRWHRASFDKDIANSVDLQMAEVNKHLIEMGEAPVSAEDIAKIKKFADLAWS